MSLPTVNLDPQDGDIAVFEELQTVFALALTQDDVGEWRTVGDIHATLRHKLAKRPDGNACATSMTFYRLRRALGARASGLKPSTPLAPLVGPNPKKWRAEVQQAVNLNLPVFPLTSVGTIGCLVGFVAFFSLLVSGLFESSVIATGSLATLVMCGALCCLDRLSLPNDLVTLGDLARAIAARNVGALARQGARVRDADIWQAVCAILAEETGTPRDQIGPDSYLFAHVLKADQKAA